MRTLGIPHLSTPWLVHSTTLIHSSHTLINSSGTSHHLSLAALISPSWITTPISWLLLRPLLLLNHLTLLGLLLRGKCLRLLLWYTTLLPRRWSALITTS